MVRFALTSAVAFACGVVTFGALSHSASAEDATLDWTGIYAGIQAGGGAGSASATTTCDDPVAFLDFTVNCAASIASGALPTKFSSNLDGPLGGVTLGYNAQFGQWLLGVEADIAKSNINSKDHQVPVAKVLDFYQETVGVTQHIGSLATLRGRIGYATGDMLFFATGGLAAGEVDARYALSEDQDGGFAIDAQSRRAIGWTIGAGAEMAFGDWSLKGEVIHYDLGSEKLSAEFELPGSGPAGPIFNSEVETSGNVLRVGLNYHFE